MSLYTSDLSALFVYAMVVALQMVWLVFVAQATGSHNTSGLFPYCF
jgi:hypothetical protein